MVGPTQVGYKPCSSLYCHGWEAKSEKGSELKITTPKALRLMALAGVSPSVQLTVCIGHQLRGQDAGEGKTRESSRDRLTWHGCREKYETSYGFRVLNSLAECCWSRSILGMSRTTV